MANDANRANSQARFLARKRGVMFSVYGSDDIAHTFNPTALNVEQWLDVATLLGAGYAMPTMFHGANYPLWNSANKTPNSYTQRGIDVAALFVAAARRRGIWPAFYHGINALDNQYKLDMAARLVELCAYDPDPLLFWLDAGGDMPAGWPAAFRTAIEVTGNRPAALMLNNNHQLTNPSDFSLINDFTLSDVSNTEGMGGIKQAIFDNSKTATCAEVVFTLAWAQWDSAAKAQQNDQWFSPTLDVMPLGIARGVLWLATRPGVHMNVLIGVPVDQTGLVPDTFVQMAKQLGRTMTDVALGQPVTVSSDGGGVTGSSCLTDGLVGVGPHQWYTASGTSTQFARVNCRGGIVPVESVTWHGPSGGANRRMKDVYAVAYRNGTVVKRSAMLNPSTNSIDAGSPLQPDMLGADLVCYADSVRVERVSPSGCWDNGETYNVFGGSQLQVWSGDITDASPSKNGLHPWLGI